LISLIFVILYDYLTPCVIAGLARNPLKIVQEDSCFRRNDDTDLAVDAKNPAHPENLTKIVVQDKIKIVSFAL